MTTPPAEGPALTSRRHPLIQRCRRIAARPALARREGRFLLDGVHLCEEALAAGRLPEQLCWAPRLERTAPGRALLRRARAAGWPLQPVSDDLLAAIAVTDSPQGVVGLFPRPRTAAPAALERLATRVDPLAHGGRVFALALDGLQDPLNLGVLARTAWAFGSRGLLSLPATVDPFHPRALRASAGMLLHLDLVTELAPRELAVWAASQEIRILRLATRGGRPLAELPRDQRPLLLVLGSEGRGFSGEVAALEAESVTIEIHREAESLGVAAAGTIALYLLGTATKRAS